jgi:alpha/beta superfamily hydrolase
MKEERVKLPSGGITLEGIAGVPDGDGPFPTVVVCHPHPLYGGDMYNNVVSTVCAALVQASLVAFRFNFCGVGGSGGRYGDGIGEQEDVGSALAYVETLSYVDKGRIGLAGYSAGAGFGVPVACGDDRVKAICAVSPPLSMFDFACLGDCMKPKLLLCGARDDFTPADRFLEFCESLPEPKECVTVEGADHFWRGHESALADRVADFFAGAL